ncbi:MAG: GTP-binding protein [Pseudomonadota bacterium]
MLFKKKRDSLKIVIVGHVDHGKSTLIGRLLLDTNSLPKEKMAEIKQVSKELGRETQLAYLIDHLKEEREKNITIDTSQIFFQTKKREYVIIDAPGHVKFLKNMISGASLAEAAILIVDAKEGMQEQTRRHAYVVSLLGLDKVIVLLNKMDLLNYDQTRFEQVKKELQDFFVKQNLKPIAILPISAGKGDNISKKSANLSWYKGDPLLKIMDNLRLSAKPENLPLRFPVQDIYQLNEEKIVVGKVAAGKINTGQRVHLAISNQLAQIKSIKIFEKDLPYAEAGQCVGLTFTEPINLERGDIISANSEPAEPVFRFQGNIFWMADQPLQLNKTLTLRLATQEVECMAEKIETRMNSSTFEVLEQSATELLQNEAALVTFKTHKPIVAEKFTYIEELGRFVIEYNYNLQGAGIIS